MSPERCEKCVNWLEHKAGVIECDFDHFLAAPYEKAALFVPQLFDCEDYEEIKE